MADSDHRRWPRMRVALSANLRFDDLDHALGARTANISRGGLFLCTADPKPIGTKVRLVLEIAVPHETFALEGVVVRTIPDPDDPVGAQEPPGVAVFLTQICDGWERFCATLELRRELEEEESRDGIPLVVDDAPTTKVR